MAGGNFFGVVQPPLVAGRGLTDADDRPDAPLAAVISDRAWAALFDRQAGAVGASISINGVTATVIGVTAPEWRGLSPGGFGAAPDAIVALRQQPVVSPEWSDGESLEGTPYYWVRTIARLRADAGDREFAETLTAAFRGRAMDGGLSAEAARAADVVTLPGARGYDGLRQTTSQPVRVLLGVAGIVLLIACINVAGLMLARGVARQKELEVRRALGATRTRVIRELLVESTVLSLAGGVAGVWLALASTPALSALVRSGLGATAFTFSLDPALLGVSAAIAVGAGIAAGLIPAIRFSGGGAGAMLQARAGNTAPRLVIGRVILALQIAISLPLVAGAGLLLRTMANFARVDLGFDASELVLFSIDPTRNGTAPDRTLVVFPQLLARIEALPGVRSATLVENALLSGYESDARITVGDRTAVMYMNSVAPHYFETMGARLIAGRAIDDRDTAGRGYPVVINEAAVRAFFPDRSPIGQRFRNGSRDLEVVGVMADAKYDSLRAAVPPTMLFSYQQRRMGAMVVVVRSDRPAAALRPDLERAVSAVDPTLPLRGFKTQREQINELLGRERVFVRLLTLFGGFALLLASVGLHGVTAYAVTRRTSEIGIRLALGAQRGQVLWMVLRQVLVLAVAGLLLGLPLAWLASPLVGSYLFGLEARDAATLAAAAAVMVGVAVLAGWRPARRAARLEAIQALRAE
jgi:predicted permease